jgi:hypothetical protein
MRIINLTQHQATPEQLTEGVFEVVDKDLVKTLLTFDDLPTEKDIIRRSAKLAAIALAYDADAAMIGGAPYLMCHLETALLEEGISPMYSFSKRVSVESANESTGEVTKTNVFKHIGFYKVS